MPVHYFAIPEHYMMHTFTTGGHVPALVPRRLLHRRGEHAERDGSGFIYLMDREAAAVSPGSDGLIRCRICRARWRPDVQSERQGGLLRRELKHKRAHFIRSIMESLGYIICRNLEAIDAMGLAVGQIRTMGGGSKSDVWNQIKADIRARRFLSRISAQDTACLGRARYSAGGSGGVFESIEERVDSMVRIKKDVRTRLASMKSIKSNMRSTRCCLLARRTV
jgi:xylulokinase